MNSTVTFSEEKWDEIILGVDENIRKKVMSGETELTLWGDLLLYEGKRNNYNLKEIHMIFEYLYHHYQIKQGFRVKIKTGNKLSECILKIKLNKVK